MAQLDARSVKASFRVPGRFSLASDGTTKLVTLSAQMPGVDLTWKTAPMPDSRALLSADFINAAAAPRPGPVMIFRDGALMGRGAMNMVAAQASCDLGFGPGERVMVTWSVVSREEIEPNWYGSASTETREFKTVLRNLNDFPTTLLRLDQISF